MMNKNNNYFKQKKLRKAHSKISFNWASLLLGVVLVLIGLFFIFVLPVFGIIIIIPGVLLISKYIKKRKAINNLEMYLVPFVNHPEYTLSKVAIMLRKDEENVDKDIEAMLAAKILYGTLDKDKHSFTLDEDFDLRYLAELNGWAGPLF